MPKIIFIFIFTCLQRITYSQVNNLLHPFVLSDDIDSISKVLRRQELSVPYAGLVLTWTNYSCYNNTCNALPVQLLFFDAERKSDSVVKVTWETTNELNHKEFIVQRSLGNTNSFKNVGWLPAEYSSSITHRYTFFDENDYENISYYRLKQIDIDNEFNYSPMVAVKGNPRFESISVYPNPATADVLLDVRLKKMDKVIVDIYNSQEQRIYKQTEYFKKGNNLKGIHIAQYDKGIYFIRIVKSDGSILKAKFIKQ